MSRRPATAPVQGVILDTHPGPLPVEPVYTRITAAAMLCCSESYVRVLARETNIPLRYVRLSSHPRLVTIYTAEDLRTMARHRDARRVTRVKWFRSER